MNGSVTGLVGWLVHSRPPAQPLDYIVVTDASGKSIASRPLAFGCRQTHHRSDIALAQLGFERAGQWDPTVGGFSCPVTTR